MTDDFTAQEQEQAAAQEQADLAAVEQPGSSADEAGFNRALQRNLDEGNLYSDRPGTPNEEPGGYLTDTQP